MTGSLESALLGRPKGAGNLRGVRVKIAAASPLTITLPDGTTVRGVPITGLTYTANENAVAFIAEGTMPVVFPTA